MPTDDPFATRRKLLERSALCRGLAPEDIARVLSLAEVVDIPTGSEVFHQHDPGNSLYVVVHGRVQLCVDDATGQRRTIDYLGVGEHFGDMGVLAGITRTASAVAVIDTQLLRFASEPFNELLNAVPGLAANLSRTLVWRLHQETSRLRRRRALAVVGLVHSSLGESSSATRELTAMIARTLVERGESVVVFTDRSWSSAGEPFAIEPLPTGSATERVEFLRSRVPQALGHHARVLVDLDEQQEGAALDSLLGTCEAVWWMADSREAQESLSRLRRHLTAPGHWGARTQVVWLLARGERFAPSLPDDLPLVRPSFKVTSEAETSHEIHAQQRGIDRLVRHLRGTRLGLALGGGGARGLAHLGVLRAFARAGIDFDALAGTSSGALFGLSYVGGWSPEFAVQEFKKALTPGRFWQSLPQGSRWFLLTKYRLRAWDAMLRPYFHQATYDQLIVPFYTVSTDLVRGRPYVRDSGDVIRGVMESINIPWVAPTIMRDGMALVDGAVVNNLPVDVLPERGVDFVIGVDVVAKLRSRFAGNTPQTPTEQMRGVTWPQILQRIVEVQSNQLSALRTGADIMISPLTAGFGFADFSKTHELAERGEAAVAEILPQLRQKLVDLENR